MPTLTELQRQQPLPLLPHPQQSLVMEEEMVADARATLTPSQLVERKLAARNDNDIYRSSPSAFRPRAK